MFIKSKMMIASIILGMCATHPHIMAQDLKIPLGQQGDPNISVPKRGVSQETVLQQFGQPYRSVENVGEPPISVWYYQGFNVYFESGQVLHSVLNAQD